MSIFDQPWVNMIAQQSHHIEGMRHMIERRICIYIYRERGRYTRDIGHSEGILGDVIRVYDPDLSKCPKSYINNIYHLTTATKIDGL